MKLNNIKKNLSDREIIIYLTSVATTIAHQDKTQLTIRLNKDVQIDFIVSSCKVKNE